MKASPKPYFVYLLLCADGTLYTGITTDVVRRLAEHKAGKGGGYTRAHTAQKMLHIEDCKDRSSALKREAAIKKLTHAQKIALIA